MDDRQQGRREHGRLSVPILIADYTWGSGRTQTALGTANTFQGIGASLSNALGGVLVVRLGWTWGFLGLVGPSLAALVLSFALLSVSQAEVPRPLQLSH